MEIIGQNVFDSSVISEFTDNATNRKMFRITPIFDYFLINAPEVMNQNLKFSKWMNENKIDTKEFDFLAPIYKSVQSTKAPLTIARRDQRLLFQQTIQPSQNQRSNQRTMPQRLDLPIDTVAEKTDKMMIQYYGKWLIDGVDEVIQYLMKNESSYPRNSIILNLDPYVRCAVRDPEFNESMFESIDAYHEIIRSLMILFSFSKLTLDNAIQMTALNGRVMLEKSKKFWDEKRQSVIGKQFRFDIDGKIKIAPIELFNRGYQIPGKRVPIIQTTSEESDFTV